MPDTQPTTKVVDAVGTDFQTVAQPAPADNLPAIAASNIVENAGGLSYKNANDAERATMDAVKGSIDLLQEDTVINLGGPQREKLADQAEGMLNELDPSAGQQFNTALSALVKSVRANSLSNIQSAIKGGVVHAVLGPIFNYVACKVKGLDPVEEANKEKIGKFMTSVSESRKDISEKVSTLDVQTIDLDKNVVRVNALGLGMTVAAQELRVVHAAVAEYIRQVESGENTVLTDLQAAQKSGRQEDTERFNTARNNWNNLLEVEGQLLKSISTYDRGIATMAFTKQFNTQNRLKTKTARTQTIADWKIQLAEYGIVLKEIAARTVLNQIDELDAQATKQGVVLFSQLVDMQAKSGAAGNRSLRQAIEAQDQMATKLEEAYAEETRHFQELAGNKAMLAQSIDQFRGRVSKAVIQHSQVIQNAGTAPKLKGPA